MFIDFRVPQVVPAQNDADDGDGDDEPTTGMPHSHQQAPRTGIKYPVQAKPLTLIDLATSCYFVQSSRNWQSEL